MSTESAKSTTTKPKETQTKPAQAQQAGIPAQEMMGLGATQLAMHNGSMAGQASLLSRLHPPQRTAMVQRMARTHSNSHLTQVIARARAQEPPRETQIEEPSLLQQSLAQYGMGNLMSSGSAAPVDSGAPASSTTGKSSVTVQTKMTVNEVNDPFEQEADQVADQVMKTPTAAAPPPSGDLNNEGGTSAISRLVIQRVGGSDPLGGATVNAGVENRVNKLDGGGEPLSDSSRSFFESRMGADFSDVRIHRDASSAELSQDLNARAFTTGNNIAFNSGEYNPGTPDGDRLLAHELTHTVQQGAAGDLSRQTIQRKAIPLPEPPQPEATPELDGEASAALEAGQMPQMSEEMMAKAEEMGFGPEALSAGPSPQEPPPEEAPALEETERAEPAEPQGEPTNQEDVGELEQKPTEPIESNPAKGKDDMAAVGDVMQSARGENQAAAATQLDERVGAKETQIGRTDEASGQAQEAGSSMESALSMLEDFTPEVEVDPVDVDSAEAEVTDILIQRETDPAMEGDESISAKASGLMGNFMAQLSSQAASISSVSTTVPDSLTATIQEAQATVQSAVTDNQAIITDTISAVQAQVEADAENTRTGIQSQYDAALAEIESSTQTALDKTNAGYEVKLADLVTLQATKQGDLDKLFSDTSADALAAGEQAATTAAAKGDLVAAEYEGKAYPEPSFFDGKDFPDRKRKAAQDAAKSTAQGASDDLKKQASETASEINAQKPDALLELEARIKAAQDLLEQEHKAAKVEIEASHAQSLAQAQEVLAGQLEIVDQGLESTTTSLIDLEERLQAQLVEMGEEQTCALEESGQQSIASIQESIAQTADTVGGGLSGLVGQIGGQGTPDLAALQAALGESEGQFGGALIDVQASIEEQISSAQEALLQQTEQSVDIINGVGELAIEQATPIGEEFAASMEELLATAETTFEALYTGHDEAVNARADLAIERFDEAYTNCETEIDQMVEALEVGLTQFITDLKEKEGGLNDTVAKVEDQVRSAAAEAESKVPPAWKKIVATIFTVIVSVFVGVLIGALVLSGIGFVAGLLIAAAIGAVGGIAKGMLDNWSKSEDLFKDIGRHALKGAIDGALQFAGGRFVRGLELPEINGGLKVLATKAAVNFVEGTVKDILNLAIDGELTWKNVIDVGITNLIGGAFDIASGGLTQGLTKGVNDNVRKTLINGGVGFVFDIAKGVSQALVTGKPIDLTQIITESATSQLASGYMEHIGASQNLADGIDSHLNGSSGRSDTGGSADDYAPDDVPDKRPTKNDPDAEETDTLNSIPEKNTGPEDAPIASNLKDDELAGAITKHPKGTETGDELRYERYVRGKDDKGLPPLSYDDWFSKSRGGRLGSVETQDIQNGLLNPLNASDASREIEVGGGRVVDVHWPEGGTLPDGTVVNGEVYIQIGGLNGRGDPINRERQAIQDIRNDAGDGITIVFIDKTNSENVLVNPDKMEDLWHPATYKDGD